MKDILVQVSKKDLKRYWILNVDYLIIDKLNQPREIACIQIDVANAQRLGIEYLSQNGEKKHPIIIHSAVSGGIERYLYMLFDRFKESFPIWLLPAQIRLIPVSDKYIKDCLKIVDANSNQPIRFEIDDRSESVAKKIRSAHLDYIPYPIVIGEKESKDKKIDNLEIAMKKIVEKLKDKPFIKSNWPVLISRQVN